MNEEIEKWLNEQAKNYKACIMAVMKNIPPKISETMELSAGDLKDIASNLYIQGCKAGAFLTDDGNNIQPKMFKDDGPSSDKQQTLIGRLAVELGKESEEVVAQHLHINGKKVVDALTKTEATELIKKLKEEKRRLNR